MENIKVVLCSRMLSGSPCSYEGLGKLGDFPTRKDELNGVTLPPTVMEVDRVVPPKFKTVLQHPPVSFHDCWREGVALEDQVGAISWWLKTMITQHCTSSETKDKYLRNCPGALALSF